MIIGLSPEKFMVVKVPTYVKVILERLMALMEKRLTNPPLEKNYGIGQNSCFFKNNHFRTLKSAKDQ